MKKEILVFILFSSFLLAPFTFASKENDSKKHNKDGQYNKQHALINR